MELSNVPAQPATSRLRLAQGLVLLFHLTGFVGLAFSRDPGFYLRYTPLTLLLRPQFRKKTRKRVVWRTCPAPMIECRFRLGRMLAIDA